MRIESFQHQYRFLSNFAPCNVVFGGIEFPTVENAYQAAKTKRRSARLELSKLGPGAAKRAGQKLELRADWEDVKLRIMLTLLRRKFKQQPFKNHLLATGDAELIEGNWWGDTFWGVYKGKGLNHLGRLLMRVRRELRAK